MGNLANIWFGICNNSYIKKNTNDVLESEKSALNIIKSQTRFIKTVIKQSEKRFNKTLNFYVKKLTSLWADIRN